MVIVGVDEVVVGGYALDLAVGLWAMGLVRLCLISGPRAAANAIER